MGEAGCDSPLGPLTLREDGGRLLALAWRPPRRQDDTAILRAGISWLVAYFSASPLPALPIVVPEGELLQQAVWRIMLEIPAGETLSYGTVAKRLGADPRAVGQACGANPLPILIPCHRIVGVDGLGGYSGAGGGATKRFLLRHEGALPADLFG